MTEAILEIKSVCQLYENEGGTACEALNGVSLNLKPGEIAGLLGQSGSGKTTILRVVAGFEKIHQGEVWLRGQRVDGGSSFVEPAKRKVGLVYQDYALFPHLTARENIAFGLYGISADERKSRVKNLAELLHISELLESYPHQMSGGQQQRVAVARALAPKPDLLLMDEPFSNLDQQLKERLISELKRIFNDLNISVLFVTHDEQEIKQLANVAGVVSEGKISKWGDINSVLEQG